MTPLQTFARRARARKAAQAALQRAAAADPVREPSASERRVLAGLFACAWQRFKGAPWYVAHLVDVGAVLPQESRRVGRLLARCAGRHEGGFALEAAGEGRDGLRWRLRVLR